MTENADTTSPQIITITLKLPHPPLNTQLTISKQEQVQDLRQSIIDLPNAFQYTCFHLEHNGEPINDFIELSEVKGLDNDSVFTLVEDPYTEKEARTHLLRIRELINAAGDRHEVAAAVSAGASLIDIVGEAPDPDASHCTDSFHIDLESLAPHNSETPKTLSSISLSQWNPPPFHLRNRGHLLYLVAKNTSNETFHITSHVSGFHVNKSSNTSFNPAPKSSYKPAHSLLTLLQTIDPKFESAFQTLVEYNSTKDPLTMYNLTNAIPATSWLLKSDDSTLKAHEPDVMRSQETYLLSGTDNSDNLRDWNEEFQSTRELPKESVPERLFRDRLTSKLFADFNEVAVKGAVLVARGEIAPLNPTEGRDAQIFVHNNVFFSFGADGVGTFATEGGDEAARVATGKDVEGVKAVNQLDISDLFTAATIIVDYMGKRIVGQSIVPGIFKQRDPGDSIDYGGVEGKDIVAEKPEFIEPFAALSKHFDSKKHPVWDKEGKRHDLEASVDTKGLLGTDGRKYVLDLYRLTPLDVNWIEKYWGETAEEKTGDSEKDYPHRMAILRPELVHQYRLDKLIERVNQDASEKEKIKITNGTDDTSEKESTDESAKTDTEESSKSEEAQTDLEKQEAAEKAIETERKRRQDIYENFHFSLNPDVFAGQNPPTDEEKEEMAKDEADVRTVCSFLTDKKIPNFVERFGSQPPNTWNMPFDGEGLTEIMHKLGINMRYLGAIADLIKDEENYRLQTLKKLIIQEIVARTFKHVANRYLKNVPHPLASACMAHLLNCLLGSKYNTDPVAESDEELKDLYYGADTAFESLTPEAFQAEIVEEARKRFRYNVADNLVETGREQQLLREICNKLGLQLTAREYTFEEPAPNGNGVHQSHVLTNGTSNGHKKKRKNKERNGVSPTRSDSSSVSKEYRQTFHAGDIMNFVPVVKEASPYVSLPP
jgi:protein TIF31